MRTACTTTKILQSIERSFSNQYKTIRENIALTTYSILRCDKVNTAEIARHMGEVNGMGFKSNDMKLYRFLRSKNFQIDDKMWRGHMRLLFGMIKESGYQKSQRFIINVDYTSDTDDFLILCASIHFQGQSIPLYFSMRKYPKRSGTYDQKKMEVAFFKALRHALPDEYEYIIVADRGFGHDRVMGILEETNFLYVLRLSENLNVVIDEKASNLKDLPHKNKQFPSVKVVKWDREISVVKRVKQEKHWLLATNLPQPELSQVGKLYEGRFSIEKMFKNQKSGGFDMENLLIKKYDRFKRLLFIGCVAYSVMIFAGLLIKNKAHPIKKNFSLTLNLLSAFLP